LGDLAGVEGEVEILWGLRIAFGMSLGIYLANHWKEGLRGLVIRCTLRVGAGGFLVDGK